jgi:galactose mutarotase-like enzyme
MAVLTAKPAYIQKVDDRMLPTGEEVLYAFDSDTNELTESLDNAFRLGENELLKVDLGTFQGRTLQLLADDSFKFFQIYNPADNIVAVEPVTSNINALNTGDALTLLPKGAKKQHEISLSLYEY